jgi:hypothetical protein
VRPLEARITPSAQSVLDSIVIEDEAAVREMLGSDLLTLGGPDDLFGFDLPGGDLAKLLLRGYAPGHVFTSFQGSGLAFDKIAALGHDYIPKLGEPTVLLYKPGIPVIGDTTDLIPDLPYEFIGWGYGVDYHPTTLAFPGTSGSHADKIKNFLDTFPADAWQVHEAGVHLFNGGFLATPPIEQTHGGSDFEDPHVGGMIPSVRDFFLDAVADGGIFHQRLWTIAFYTDPAGGTAKAAIKDPFNRVPVGFPNGEESFFFPELPYLSTPQPASRVEAENFDMSEGYGWHDSTLGNRDELGDYRLTDVDLSATQDINGGFDVSETASAESLAYTIDVPVVGMHEFGFRVTNDQANAQFRLFVDGNLVGDYSIPTTAGASVYTAFEPVTLHLSAQQHRVGIQFLTSPAGGVQGPRINYFYVRHETPTAHLRPIPPITGSGVSFTEFSITYRDDDAINRSMVDSQDIRVHRVGGGFEAAATLVSATPSTNADEVFAVYRVDAPEDSWDPSDRGEYEIIMQSGQVRDATSVAVLSGKLGSFRVDVPFFEQIPVPREIDEIDLYINLPDFAGEIHLDVLDELLQLTSKEFAETHFPLKIINSITIFANGGNDTVLAAGVPVPLTIHGGTGDDELVGGELGDVIRGGPGNDLLDGRGGIDFLFGDEGDDKAILSKDRDIIDLGDNRDGLTIEGTERRDVIAIERILGTDGPEVRIRMNGELFTAAYLNGETLTVFGKGGNDLISAVGATSWSMELFGQVGNDILAGGNLADILDGGSGRDVFMGRQGADRIFARDGGADVIFRDEDDILESWDWLDLPLSRRRLFRV